jgi:WD40 repeat protein
MDGIIKPIIMKLEFIKTMEGHRSPVNAMTFTSDGKYAVSVANGSLHAIAIHPKQKHMVTTGPDKLIKLWNLENFKEVSIMNHPTSLKSMAFSPDGKYLFLGEMSGKIQVYKCA